MIDDITDEITLGARQLIVESCKATQNWIADSLKDLSQEDQELYDIHFGVGAWEEDFGNE